MIPFAFKPAKGFCFWLAATDSRARIVFDAQGKDDPAHLRTLAAQRQGQDQSAGNAGLYSRPRHLLPSQAPIFAAVKGGPQNEWVLTGRWQVRETVENCGKEQGPWSPVNLFKFWRCHLLAKWSEGRYLSTLCFSFFICRNQEVVVPTYNIVRGAEWTQAWRDLAHGKCSRNCSYLLVVCQLRKI